MTPPTAWAHKGDVVEEWIDLHFFRPLGARVVRWAAPRRVSADQLTVVSLVLGLAAGHLFFYRSPALNVLGLLLFVVSDVFDSADGQLARLRGSSTRFGRQLDGISDNLRFINLYLHLIARLIVARLMPWPAAAALGLLAGYSHSLQSGVADWLRQCWLEITGGGGELDLPEDLADRTPETGTERVTLALYRGYIGRLAAWCPRATAAVRALRSGTAPAGLRTAWRLRQAGSVARSALIAQNVRFLVLGLTVCLGWTPGFFWVTVGPLNLALVWVLVLHERVAGGLLAAGTPPARLAVAGEG